MAKRKTAAAQAKTEDKPVTKVSRKKPAAASSTSVQKADGDGTSALVRVYRHGLGDCILIRLPKRDGSYYKILIDCGVALATADAKTKMSKVVQDVLDLTGGAIDALALTHQHWDHVSGFIQVEDLFNQLKVGEVWVAWTENEKDDLAQELRKEHGEALKALALCTQAFAASGDRESSQGILNILGVSGDGTDKTGAAFSKAMGLGRTTPKYWLPKDAPLKFEDPNVRIFAFGPPHDAKAIRRTLPSKVQPETYELALDGSGVVPCDVASVLLQAERNPQPFADTVTIPFEMAQSLPFFQNHYWGTSGASEKWRRIDTDWLGASENLALALQSATNNTSLVLAIELANNKVLLFAADAQVGNWLSWQDLAWDVEGQQIKGPDLLARTVLYKVGHHGSFNATLKEEGLDEMTALQTAVIPVDHEVAAKMRWGNMPLESLVAALNEKTKGRVLRTDMPPSTALEGVTVNDLYYEVSIN